MLSWGDKDELIDLCPPRVEMLARRMGGDESMAMSFVEADGRDSCAWLEYDIVHLGDSTERAIKDQRIVSFIMKIVP